MTTLVDTSTEVRAEAGTGGGDAEEVEEDMGVVEETPRTDPAAVPPDAPPEEKPSQR